MSKVRWIIPLRCVAGDRARLFCFHHAGGSAWSFAAWSRALAEGISIFGVQLPGRHPSSPLEPTLRLQDLMVPLAQAWHEFHASIGFTTPFAFYGHSLGALVAFELGRKLRDENHRQPVTLIVSGRRAPQCILAMFALSDLPEAELLRALKTLGGMPRSLLASEKWLALLIPTVRADLQLSDHYRYAAAQPLACPVYAYMGEDDPILTPYELSQWRHETTGQFSMETLSGGHFFSEPGLARLHARVAAATLQNAAG